MTSLPAIGSGYAELPGASARASRIRRSKSLPRSRSISVAFCSRAWSARKAGENFETESKADAQRQREELMAQTRRDIEAETRRAIQEIRKEVADLTVLATEKVTRKTLTDEDQKRLVEEALSELDFDQISADARRN